jgi:soluble lytic murein transglycosylase
MTRLATDPEQGRAGLHAIADAVPLSYYGLQSAGHLGLVRGPEKDFLGKRNGLAVHLPFLRARVLAENGFPSNARDELESRLRRGSLTREERITAAEQLHDLGEHFRAVRVLIDGFGDSLEQGIDPGWRDVWKLAWPRPFEGPVASAVGEFNGDPALIYAVIREESTYRPAVESPAGAIGLMQLIPPTATRIASTLGVRPFEPASLVSPSLNVRFGTYYLEQLLTQFQGERPLAIAAYNAGPEAVASWIDANDEFATDRFVESVPYGETRRYVRKVLRSYRMYRLLYFDPAEPAAGPQSQESTSR